MRSICRVVVNSKLYFGHFLGFNFNRVDIILSVEGIGEKLVAFFHEQRIVTGRKIDTEGAGTVGLDFPDQPGLNGRIETGMTLSCNLAQIGELINVDGGPEALWRRGFDIRRRHLVATDSVNAAFDALL